MNKFTKGEWEHKKAPEGCSEQIYAPQAGDGNGGLITVIQSGVSKAEDIANADLIAAAPDMFEALKNLLPYFSMRSEPDFQSITREAEDALAKAGGLK